MHGDHTGNVSDQDMSAALATIRAGIRRLEGTRPATREGRLAALKSLEFFSHRIGMMADYLGGAE